MKKDPMDVDNQDEIAQKLTEASASIAQTIVKELNNGVPIRSLFTPGSASLKELTSRIARVVGLGEHKYCCACEDEQTLNIKKEQKQSSLIWVAQ
jgi:hypothetical protein